MIQIRLHEMTYTVPKGTSLGDIWNRYGLPQEFPVVLGMVNGSVCDFQTPVIGDADISWITLNTREGQLAYQRTLILLLVRAVAELYPTGKVAIEHSLGLALYGELDFGKKVPTYQDVMDIKEKMHSIQMDSPHFEKVVGTKEECLHLLEKFGQWTDYEIVNHLNLPEVTYYKSGEVMDYYFGPMLPDFSYLASYDLEPYAPGFLLRYPELKSDMKLEPYREIPKFAKVFLEAKEWGRMLDCSNVMQLNEYISNGKIEEIIEVAEALQEKKRAQIADFIAQQKPSIKLIAIAGPSSAGKTTFTQRLCTQLRVNRLKPIMISLDDYFFDREKTPLLPDGSYDFESLKAIDIDLFGQQLLDLYAGKDVYLPRFDFKKGKRVFSTEPVRLEAGSPVVVEGLHALNDEISRILPRYEKYKIYLGAFTQLSINEHNRISTSDTRLVRRLVRDAQFRGHSAEMTFSLWDAVRQGEETNIFPFQEDADSIFNSALLYELSVLKSLALPLLLAVPTDSPWYYQAYRLLRFLSPFTTLELDVVPEKSILREFIGPK